MDSNANFTYENTHLLSEDPKFNFLNILRNNNTSHDNWEIPHSEYITPYENYDINCSYSSTVNCSKKSNNALNILSFNIQSLCSKFNDLTDLISELCDSGSQPDLICLQEIWQLPNDSNFCIHGYQPLVYKCRSNNTQGGGLEYLCEMDSILL